MFGQVGGQVRNMGQASFFQNAHVACVASLWADLSIEIIESSLISPAHGSREKLLYCPHEFDKVVEERNFKKDFE